MIFSLFRRRPPPPIQIITRHAGRDEITEHATPQDARSYMQANRLTYVSREVKCRDRYKRLAFPNTPEDRARMAATLHEEAN